MGTAEIITPPPDGRWYDLRHAGARWKEAPGLRMISFETPEALRTTTARVEQAARELMRPVARYFDRHEDEVPWDYIRRMQQAVSEFGGMSVAPSPEGDPLHYQRLAHTYEMLAWGDAGLYLCAPRGGLGAAAVAAAGTPQQRERFLARFGSGRPVFSAMAITEAQAGSDTSAIRTTAVREGQAWVLNGEKIFVTGGHKALIDTPGFVVVWATLDPALGRGGIRPFVVEAGTPGASVTKLEKKLGIRASDTATVLLRDCRVPLENLLGGREIEGEVEPGGAGGAEPGRGGYRSVLQTFDATRPLVAASALGIARAALEFLSETLAQRGMRPRTGLPPSRMTNLERELADLQMLWRSAWLLVLKAAWAADQGRRNTLEAAMAKVRAGEVVVRITQKAVELLGPLGLSQEHLLEKWFRDAKINDLYEGTGQINRLIVARQLLGYSRHQLS
jgi:acyl-CoA dehydrogenase